MFTGSTEVARLIQKQLAGRLLPDGRPVPLIAETGGLNAMIVDSSALPEQVVADVLASAFDSAGQRCSALRILCLQEDVADRMLTMLKGGLAELSLGSPDLLSVDIGPVITPTAQQTIIAHIEAMRAKKCHIEQLPLPVAARHGTFVPPTLIELAKLSDLKAEVFGPVLHVVRYRRQELDSLINAINASGYGLTFGLHSRIDETIAHVAQRIEAGNLYINRNIIGAVVGVQPFGGHGLSGTGPKAGGPLYLRRLLSAAPALDLRGDAKNDVLAAYLGWLKQRNPAAAQRCDGLLTRSPLGHAVELPGPVGERNAYALLPRGAVRCVAAEAGELLVQVATVLATGNRAVISEAAALFEGAPQQVMEQVVPDGVADAILFAGAGDQLIRLAQQTAELAGPIAPIHIADGGGRYPLEMLVAERSVSANTSAAGGNASLMSIG
jgi:RHH-type proline utilization regulon transcriptional repressor/proline dehydrogenase/delta 1-pyrroline-5-carboxylate dehydrogenase